MKEIEILQKLDAATAKTDAESIDVSDGVIREIRMRTRPAEGETPMWIVALLGSAAAATAVVFAIEALSLLQDPFNSLLGPVKTAFQ